VIYIDAISKNFAGTGLRLGWGVMPPHIQPKIKALIGHMGAWAPRPFQSASTWFLGQRDLVDGWLASFKPQLQLRLDAIYDAFTDMAARGLPVEAIPPQGAIYLSVRLGLVGRQRPGGGAFESNEDIRRYLLEDARVALVPFQAFGMEGESGWFRMSIGAVGIDELRAAMGRLGDAVARVG
jgi:aspartate aminotransferase